MYGVAVGDALGAPVEFLTLEQIRERYGATGITDLDGWGGHPAGSFTDDTQMTLATAIGLLSALHDHAERGASDLVASLHGAYGAWLELQNDPAEQRAPGHTCITALGSGRIGTVNMPLNNSKGCGGVMRVSPIGLAFPAEMAFRHGVDAAAVTHGHASGYLAAGYLAELIARVAEGEDLMSAASESCNGLGAWPDHGEVVHAVHGALAAATGGRDATEAIPELGAGWVAEEALAIGLFCAVRFAGDVRQACLAAVNHSGDSDSTGSICGALLGAAFGVDAMPSTWVERIERRTLLERIARQLHEGFVAGIPPS
jgi:ADP-ribosylglycohydrolase